MSEQQTLDTDTPKTDANTWMAGDSWAEKDEVVDADFAREMERENIRLREALEKIKSIFGNGLSNENVEESLRLFKSDVVRIIRGIMYGEMPEMPFHSLFAREGSRELYIAPNSMKKDQDGSFVILSDLSRENVALFFSDDSTSSGCVAKINEEINKHIKKDRKRKIISAFRERAKKDFEIFLESMENSIIDLLDDEKKNS